MSAENFDSQGCHPGSTGKNSRVNTLLMEDKNGAVELEVLGCDQKLLEVWNIKFELVEECNMECLDKRGRDLRKKRFQVSASTAERKPTEGRQYDACYDWCMQQLPLSIMVGDRGIEVNHEFFQMRQV